ncbi:hypothetical protein [Cohnella panacarvi]|uniref:hypothetical protein n=1 Tax=Cohnella panacarvi TaxID=400776 RepID=UPI00047933D5|nr:hypothetical protein [Cohnella panacarvi]
MRFTTWSRLACAGFAMTCLQGCMNAGTSNLSAEDAFALSASALSGSESYGLSGEVSVIDSGGFVANKLAYEGEVTGHGNLNVQWTSLSAKAAAERPVESNYEPLDLLKSIQDKTAVIKYAGGTVPDQVRFTIKLDDAVAKRRIADQLRKELSALEQDKVLLERNPRQSAKVISNAKTTLEDVLSGLKVTTNCEWYANKRTWFPKKLQEETVLQYEWKGKAYREKRVSVTNFRAASRSGTID